MLEKRADFKLGKTKADDFSGKDAPRLPKDQADLVSSKKKDKHLEDLEKSI